METNNTEKMEKPVVRDVFDALFKYKVGESLCHKGDTKSYSRDMGLLVLHRLLYESVDDDGNYQYERSYICRTVQFSGSGQQIQFREYELMTVEEHAREEQKMRDESDAMRREVKALQKEVYAAFGVQEESVIQLKNADGSIDTTRKFRPTGFRIEENGPLLSVKEILQSLDQKVKREEAMLDSKDQFIVLA